MATPEKSRFESAKESAKNWLLPATAVAGTLGLTGLGFFGLRGAIDSLKGTDPIRIPDDGQLIKPKVKGELSWVVVNQREADESDCGGETIKYLPDVLVHDGQNQMQTERLPHGRVLVVCKLAELSRTNTDDPIQYVNPQIVRFDPAAQAAG